MLVLVVNLIGDSRLSATNISSATSVGWHSAERFSLALLQVSKNKRTRLTL